MTTLTITDRVPLVIFRPTGRCVIRLRRFRYGDPGGGHPCDATATVMQDAEERLRKPDGRRYVTSQDERFPPEDPRWPASCACGREFAPADRSQVNELSWYESGGGARFAWGIGSWDGPPGAMIRSEWRDVPGRPPAWAVFLPNGSAWNTNHRLSPGDGGYWDVTGEAPLLTVLPSINDGDPARPWHGWIREGMLVRA